MVYVTVPVLLVPLTNVWLIVVPVPFDCPDTPVVSTADQLKVVPVTFEVSGRLKAVPEQIEVKRGLFVTAGIGFTTTV